jgi:hypothetical protein
MDGQMDGWKARLNIHLCLVKKASPTIKARNPFPPHISPFTEMSIKVLITTSVPVFVLDAALWDGLSGLILSSVPPVPIM